MIDFWKKHFLWCELSLVALLTVGFAYWGFESGGFTVVDSVLSDNRAAVYGALATIFGSLLGFVIVAVSVVANYSTAPRMKVVRDSKHYASLWNVFISTIRALGFATLVALIGLVLDRSDDPARIVMILVLFGTAWSAARVGRSVWVLENVIQVIVNNGDSGTSNNAQ